MSRRRFLSTGIGTAALASAGGLTLGGLVRTVEAHESKGSLRIGFTGIPPMRAPVADRVTVPEGYTAQVFVSWGDPIMPGGSAFRGDASESAAEQAKQFGEHATDALFPPA